MRAGKMGSFLSWAVSTRILRGPLGQSTASRSEETTEETIQTVPLTTGIEALKPVNR